MYRTAVLKYVLYSAVITRNTSHFPAVEAVATRKLEAGSSSSLSLRRQLPTSAARVVPYLFEMAL